MFSRDRIPAPAPHSLPFPGLLLSFLGSGPPRDAAHSFGRRVFLMWLLVTRWRQPLFSHFHPMIIPCGFEGASPAYFHPLVLVSVSEARFSSRYMVLQVPGFATGAADCLQASPDVCRERNDGACCKTNENRSRRRPIFVPSR